MRPSDAFGRPRPSAEGDTPAPFHHPGGPQMTYFLADESYLDSASLDPSSSTLPHCRDPRKHHISDKPELAGGHATTSANAGVASTAAPDLDPAEALCYTGEDSSPETSDNTASTRGLDGAEDSRPATPSYRSTGTPASHAQPPLPPSLSSHPMTPIILGVESSGPASAVLSSSSSRRNSFEGSLSEDLPSGPMSLAGEGGGHLLEQSSTSMMDSGSAPQLIMPSIKMPSRRPFTEEGKSMGRLKVLIAGDSGVGKTSLIKAIVQSCPHIVHVDPIAPASLALGMRAAAAASSSSKGKAKARGHRADLSTTNITEIYASTKPYPQWWAEVDEFSVMKRRKSLGDTILDRNVCFVDTPGYGAGSSPMDTITPVVQYVEAYLQRLCSNLLSDSDLLGLVSGDGGSHVDVVFYLISHELKPVDVHYLRQLASITNVIPLLARADTMSSEQLAESKRLIAGQLRGAGIRPFSFNAYPASFSLSSPEGPTSPYAISSAPGSDYDTMDASLLMSPDYVQPLIPTELAALVDQVFCQDGVSRLRHSAARKLVQRRSADTASRPQALYRPLSYPPAAGSALGPALASAPGPSAPIITPPMGATSSFALARITDHTQKEERLAQIRLANWAAELQRSLANERARFEALARDERAVWLTERLNECVQDGTLVPVSRREGRTPRIRDRGRHRYAAHGGSAGSPSTKTLQHQDPLGLLEVAAELRSKSWLALEVLGSLGVLGGLAFWMSKHYWHLQAYEWVISEWSKFWNGER